MGSKRTSGKTEEMLMIAAHRLDLVVRCITCWHVCFIAREGQSLHTLSSKPDFS
jgi:2-haloacid dehalogenase